MAVDLSNTMVYPQMFPLGDGPSEGGSQQEQGRHAQQSEENYLQPQRTTDLLRQQQEQMQRQQQQASLQAASTSPSLGPALSPGGMTTMNTNSMLAAGISPAVIDAHQRRTQSILNAAIVAANQAGDAAGRAGSLTGATSLGMGAATTGAAGMGMGAGMSGLGGSTGMPMGGGMSAGMGSTGMGFGAATAAALPSFNRPGGYGGYGQNLSEQQAASLLQNRYSQLGAAGLPSSYGMGAAGMSVAGAPMGTLESTSTATPTALPPTKRKSEKKKKPSAAPKRPAKKRAKTFPEKLMQAMMDNPNDDAVAWLPDGKSFVVVNPEEFVESVLKKVFKGCKYSSFVRKLHRWGFVRLTSGTGTDCFHHPLFQKNRGDLCLMITCSPRDAKGSDKNNPALSVARNEKPPSLAGVEKFIKAKAQAAAAGARDDQDSAASDEK